MFIVFHVLHCALYILLFSKNEFNIDGKKQELKKEAESNNTGSTNAKRERQESQSSDTLKVDIPHKAHT